MSTHAIRAAMQFHKAGDFETAREIYEGILALHPGHPDALHALGMMYAQQGHPGDALPLMVSAVAARPDMPAWLGNLGNVYYMLGDHAMAVECWRGALDKDPTLHAPLLSLTAELLESGNASEVVATCINALSHMPRDTKVLHLLAHAHISLGEHKEALRCYSDILEVEPQDHKARHMLCAVTAQLSAAYSAPARPDLMYIESYFDEFAPTFDSTLEKLKYKTPERMARMVVKHLAPRSAGVRRIQTSVLDTGCGTGAFGKELDRIAGDKFFRLSGVDISEKMLRRIGTGTRYARLYRSDIVAFMNSHSSWAEIVVAADVFCYFGDLAPVLQAVHYTLRPNGRVYFTVELHDDPYTRYTLETTGRYSHSEQYVREILKLYGFIPRTCTQLDLRMEQGAWVKGLLVEAVMRTNLVSDIDAR